MKNHKKEPKKIIDVEPDKNPAGFEDIPNYNEELILSIDDKKVLTDKISEIKEVIKQVEPEKTEKRGRPKGSSNTKKTDVKPEAGFVFPLSSIISIFIERLPHPIPLSESEKSVLDSTGTKVLNKYMDNFEYSDEIILATVLIGVVYPRTKKPDEPKP